MSQHSSALQHSPCDVTGPIHHKNLYCVSIASIVTTGLKLTCSEQNVTLSIFVINHNIYTQHPGPTLCNIPEAALVERSGSVAGRQYKNS